MSIRAYMAHFLPESFEDQLDSVGGVVDKTSVDRGQQALPLEEFLEGKATMKTKQLCRNYEGVDERTNRKERTTKKKNLGIGQL